MVITLMEGVSKFSAMGESSGLYSLWFLGNKQHFQVRTQNLLAARQQCEALHHFRHGWDWWQAVNQCFCHFLSLLSKAMPWITTAQIVQRLCNSMNSFRFTCTKQSAFLLSLISPRRSKHSAKHLITSKPYCVKLQLHISRALWCYLTTGADYLFFRWRKLIQSVFHYTSGFFSCVPDPQNPFESAESD